MGVFDNFPYTNVHELNLDWIIKQVKEIKDKEELIDQAVLSSQQYAEQAGESANSAENIYNILSDLIVTPEMFGGVGDGVADDTQAIQDAVNSGKIVLIPNKTYKTEGTIYLKENPFLNMGNIRYQGTDYALYIQPHSNLASKDYTLGNIYAPYGGCLYFDSSYAWIQYINIDFNILSADDAHSAVYANVVHPQYINEIRFFNGRFSKGLNGVYIDKTYSPTNYTSHWDFDKVGFEGITNGVNIPAYVGPVTFTDCRAEESLTNVVLSRATSDNVSQHITWSGSRARGLYWKNADYYVVTFTNGCYDSAGSLVTSCPVLSYNGMLHSIDFNNGVLVQDSAIPNMYNFDSNTLVQEVDFKAFCDLTNTTGYENNVYRRYFITSNNTSATSTDIYLDDRLFMPKIGAYVMGNTNTYLLEVKMSPNQVLTIYNKRNGTSLFTKTNGSTTTTYYIQVARARSAFYITELTLKRKTI